MNAEAINAIKDPTEHIEEFLKALADKSRLDIIKFLKNGEKTSQEIQDMLGKGQSTVSQQLKVLILANIVNFRVVGVKKFYSIKDTKIFQLLSQINSYILGQSQEKVDAITSLGVMDTLQ